MKTASRQSLAILLVVAGLGAASLPATGTEVQGSPEIPGSFGRTEKPWYGCPKVNGVYAWPPAEGKLADAPGPIRKDPWANLAGLSLPPRAYLWIDTPKDGGSLRLRALKRPLNENAAVGIAERWSLRTLANSEFNCRGGELRFEEPNTGDAKIKEWYGGTVSSGMRIMALKDGGLALGQWIRVTDRTTSAFSWGDVHRGSVKIEDRLIWHWARLARIASSGESIAIDRGP